MRSLNHKQTNGNFSVAHSASISGSNLWCAERLTSVRKQRQDKEGPFSPVLSLRVAFSRAVSTVRQLHGHRQAKTLKDAQAEMCINHAFQELSTTRKSRRLPADYGPTCHFSQRCLPSANSSSLRLLFFFSLLPEVSQG